MKTRHSQLSEPDVISVFVGTWNMGNHTWWWRSLSLSRYRSIRWRSYLPSCFLYTGGSPPPRSLQSWVTCCGLGHTPDDSTALLPHDIYALGTQENPQGEREWTEHIKATLRSYTQTDFKQVILLFQISNFLIYYRILQSKQGALSIKLPYLYRRKIHTFTCPE